MKSRIERAKSETAAPEANEEIEAETREGSVS